MMVINMSTQRNQYFMYGIIIPFKTYLEMRATYVVDDIFNADNDIQGIFSGRDSEFIIIGSVLDVVEDNGEAQIVPELNDAEINIVRGLVKQKYGITGEYHYYFIKK